MSEATKNLPTVVIKPERRWLNFELAEVWQYRELLYFLTLRDIQIRYKQTLVGVVWAILQPVLTTIIFTIIFTRLGGFSSADAPYPLFAMSGLLLWLFVNNSISMSSMALLVSSALVTKVYVPRVIPPMGHILSSLIDLMIGLVVLALMLVYYGIVPTPQMLLAPVFIVMTVLLVSSLGILFAGLNVLFRDVKHALPFLLQIWMFLSPIFYGPEILSENWRFVFKFNPLYGIIQGFRSSILGLPFDWPAVIYSFVISVVMLIGALLIFKNIEDSFADVI